MRWELIYGKDQQWVDSLPDGTPAKNKPELWPENLLAARLFHALLGQRFQTFDGAGEIPVSEIFTLAMVWGIEDIESVVPKVMTLDKEFLKFIKEQQERKQRAGIRS